MRHGVNGILIAAFGLSSWLQGCAIEIHEDDDNEGVDYVTNSPGNSQSVWYLPGEWREKVDQCEKVDKSTLMCFKDEDRTWYSNCKSGACEEVAVTVHYMLSEDLGSDSIVHVEAFDNPRFTGNPVSILQITGFDATRAGTRSDDVMFLAPGEYYFRAYLADEGEVPVPYQYQDMELVSGKPLGLYGALSHATKLMVHKTRYPQSKQPINIYIDKLMKRAGAEEATNAHLRIKLSIEESYEVPFNREVLIQLFDQEDFSYDPKQSYQFPSENLLIKGRLGKAEFITPDLPEGRYFLQAFLDLSSNEFLDEGEPHKVFMKYGEKAILKIEKDRTETINLNLVVPGETEGEQPE